MSTLFERARYPQSGSTSLRWDSPRVAASARWTSVAGDALRHLEATVDSAVDSELALSARFQRGFADSLRRELRVIADATATELTIEVNYAVPPLGALLTDLLPLASLRLFAVFHCSVAAAALAEDRRRLELSLRVARHVYRLDEPATRRWAAMSSNGEAGVLAGAWWEAADALGADVHDRRAREAFERLHERVKTAARPLFRSSVDRAGIYG